MGGVPATGTPEGPAPAAELPVPAGGAPATLAVPLDVTAPPTPRLVAPGTAGMVVVPDFIGAGPGGGPLLAGGPSTTLPTRFAESEGAATLDVVTLGWTAPGAVLVAGFGAPGSTTIGLACKLSLPWSKESETHA